MDGFTPRYLSGLGYATGPRRKLDDLIGAAVLDPGTHRALSDAGVRCYHEDPRSVEEMWTAAATSALAQAGITHDRVEAIVIVGSGTAGAASFECLRDLGCKQAFIVNLGPLDCSGDATAVKVASSLISDRSAGTVLVIACGRCANAEERVDPHLKSVFGDGAAACAITADEGAFEIAGSCVVTDTALAALAYSGQSTTSHLAASVRLMKAVIGTACERARTKIDDLLLAFCTSPNRELLHFMCGAVRLPRARIYDNLLSDHGHILCCDTLIGLCDYVHQEALHRDDHFLLYSWAPFAIGATIVRYTGH